MFVCIKIRNPSLARGKAPCYWVRGSFKTVKCKVNQRFTRVINQFEKKSEKNFWKLLSVTKKWVLLARRIARVVEWTGLENRRTSRYRGFESLILRQKRLWLFQSLFFVLLVWDSNPKGAFLSIPELMVQCSDNGRINEHLQIFKYGGLINSLPELDKAIIPLYTSHTNQQTIFVSFRLYDS